ncbi:MAG: hypothetical protein ACK5LS_02665 [Propioniciclava sp.]
MAKTIVELIVHRDGNDDAVGLIASRLGVSAEDLARYEEFTDHHGDDPDMLGELHEFQTRAPKELAEALLRQDLPHTPYDGEFPLGTPRPATCYFEYAEDALAGVADLPPWLQAESDKQAIFDERLSAGDAGTAWLALNGPGWTPSHTCDALGALLRHGPTDPGFATVANLWITHAQGAEDDYGY